MNRTDFPACEEEALHNCNNSFSINWRVCTSNAEKGSSIKIIFGSSAKVWANAILFCIPPES